jgi:oligopeptidase B
LTTSGARPPKPETRPGLRRSGGKFFEDTLIWLRDTTLPESVREHLQSERAYYDSQKFNFSAETKLLASNARAKIEPEMETPLWHAGERTFRYRWTAGAEYFQLFEVQSNGLEILVLDESSLTNTGFIRLGDLAISPDGRLMAYSIDISGAEKYELRVRDLDSYKDVAIVSGAVTYGILWFEDSHRFLFTKTDAAARPCEVWLHDLGDPSNSDKLVFREGDESYYLELKGSGDGKHAIIQSSSRLTSETYLVDLGVEEPKIVSLRPRKFGHRYSVEPVGTGDAISFLVIESDQKGLDTLVEYSNTMLTDDRREIDLGLDVARLRSVLKLKDVVIIFGRSKSRETIWFVSDFSDSPIKLQPLDANGMFELDIYDSGDPSKLCLKYESKHLPPEWFSFSPTTGALESISKVKGEFLEKSEYESIEIELEARDGISIPVTITKRRTTPLDGTAPCLLYGYGAWEIVIRNDYSSALLALLDQGFVYAHAHIRGGGEVNRQWWIDGSGNNKFRTFEDFCDVAGALGSGLVDSEKIIARGLSAGGLLMGAVYGSRPELFAGVIAEAPFVDPITTMSDPSAPLVIIEYDEWGNPNNEEDLQRMLMWSPFENCPNPKIRPPLLVTGAINDPRVSVWEPARWVAKMRMQGDSHEIIFKADLGARGHWAPPGRLARIDYEAELLGWALSIAQTVSSDMRSET